MVCGTSYGIEIINKTRSTTFVHHILFVDSLLVLVFVMCVVRSVVQYSVVQCTV